MRYLLFVVGLVGAVALSLPVLIPQSLGWLMDTLAYGSYYGTGHR